VGIERMQSVGSLPEGCFVALFSLVPRECSLFTAWCAICWACKLRTIFECFGASFADVMHTCCQGEAGINVNKLLRSGDTVCTCVNLMPY
jgi:hypothetical protein